MDFLKSVAKHYVRRLSQGEWAKTVFVFPNHRSGVFFSDAVSGQMAVLRRAGRPHVAFGLNVTTLGDLVAKGGGLRIADQVTLRCELYDAYRHIDTPEGAMRFETFYSWAGTIVKDFDDIDKSLASPMNVYRNVREWQELSDDLGHLSDNQREAIERYWKIVFTEEETAFGEKRMVHKRFVDAYGRMEALYAAFRKQLEEKRLAYPGMLYRRAAEGDTRWDDDGCRYVFIGFCLLTNAEQAIMRRLQKAGRAEFFWDYEPWMLEPSAAKDVHSAGFAVAQWVEKFPAPHGYVPPRATPRDAQEVRLLKTTYSQSQASVVAATVLRGFTDKDATAAERRARAAEDHKRSVIVITDEQMLLPVLSVIPSDVVRSLNVTMGYSLRYSNVSGLVHLMADLQSGMNQRRSRTGEPAFNSQVALSVLRHPYVAAIDGLEPTRDAARHLIDNNVSFVTPAELGDLALTRRILRHVEPAEVADYATDVLEAVLSHFAHEQGAVMDRETIWEALKVARRMPSVVGIVMDDISNPRLMMHILCSMIDQQKVDFQGMPLGGLQLMGILETRAVDFDNVIILDMVDGNWPRTTTGTETMIPMTIRRNNGMLTTEEVDSTYNYYFYRLKSRAKRLTILQPTEGPQSRPTEQSRYVMQMRMLDRLEIEEISTQRSIRLRQPETIAVDKGTVRDMMRGCTTISPTSLSKYIECGLRFFFSDVARIDVDEEITDEADNRHLGIIYHHVMERLYTAAGQTAAGKLLNEEFLRQAAADKKGLSSLIMEGFRLAMRNDQLKTEDDLNGRNIVTFSVILRLVTQTLASEKPGTTVEATEENVQMPFRLDDGREITLKGIIDRQHQEPDGEGQLFVTDYKTGAVGKDGKLSIANLDELFVPKKHKEVKAATQVMTYCHILRHGGHPNGGKEKRDMVPYVLSAVGLHKKDHGMANRTVAIGDTKNKHRLVYSGETADEFDRLLSATINEIFDESVPFQQTENSNSCENCDYRHICKR